VRSDVDGLEVDPDSPSHARGLLQQRLADRPALLAAQDERRVRRPDRPRGVLAAVAIPEEVQACCGTKLEDVDLARASAFGNTREKRRQHPTPLNLVGLDALVANECLEEVMVIAWTVIPRRLSGEDEEVHAPEQPERHLPRRLRADDLRHGRVLRPRATEPRVQRRTRVAVQCLRFEDLALLRERQA
jgi:hypothetical protein